jgi:hypothetical protein
VVAALGRAQDEDVPRGVAQGIDVRRRVDVKNGVMAVLFAGALVLSASGPALAAGKLGGAGGMDRQQTSLSEEIQGSKLGIEPDYAGNRGEKPGAKAND